MATADMEADGSTDVEKHIHNLEFENQQFVKAIEKERTIVYSLEAQITEYEADITQLQQATNQLDEDTKLYHRQFLQNRDNIESLKTSVRLSEHVDALKDQFQHVLRIGQQEKEEHERTLIHYNKICSDYDAQYSKFPQAQVLNQAKQELQKAQENLSVAIGRKHHIQEKLKKASSENGQTFKPYKTVNEFVVKLAEIKVSSMRKEEEIRTTDKECKEIEQEIEKRLALRSKKEAERKQQEEAQRRHELELQRQREEDAQRKREEEARRLHEEALRKREEEAQKKQEEEELKRNAWFIAPRLQMPPIIAQRGIKLPTLQMPRRPSASMPQLNIPPMSPRLGASSRPAQAPLPRPQAVPATAVTTSAIRPPPSPTPSTSRPMSSNYSAASSPLIPSGPSRPPGSRKGAPVAGVPTLQPSGPLVTRPADTSSNAPMEEAATSAIPSSRSLLVPNSTTSTNSPIQMSQGDSPTVPIPGTVPQNTTNAQMETTNTHYSPPPVKTSKRSEQDVAAKDSPRNEKVAWTPGRTPGRTTINSTANTPETPASAFSIEKELARMKLLTADSPSSGFLYSRRDVYEEISPQWQEPPAVKDKEKAGLSFYQPFQGPVASKGGGDELPLRGGNKVSPKNTATTEPSKDVMPAPSVSHSAGDTSTGFMQGFNFSGAGTSAPSRAGMGMFGSPRVQEESGFNFFKTPSAAADNHMNLFGDSPIGEVGGFESSAPSTNVFSMFGGDSNGTEDGDSGQGGFSFNFGGTETNDSSKSSSAAFSLF